MMSAAAWFPTGFPTPQRSPRQAAVQRARVPAMPADAAEWLRARFDWTFGAVWVASERWQVPAETVVAWAERLRAGGARAGLSTKERTWICKQLSDPERQPTAAERAMARAAYQWNDPAAAGPASPVAINGIDDAIALLEARLADEGTDRTTRDARELRELLLDDLRVLRDERGRERRGEIATTEREECVDEMTAAEATTTDTTSAPVAKDEKGYLIREAICLHCGTPFTSKRYPSGWTSYCSQSCGAKGRFADRAQKAAKGNAQPASAPAPAQEPAPPVLDEAARYIHSEAEAEAEQEEAALLGVSDTAADDADAVTGDDTAQPTAAHERTERTASDPLGGLAALWKLLTQPTAQPLLSLPPLTQSAGVALPASGPAAPIMPSMRTPEPPDDSLLIAFLDRLPAAKSWTTHERERWLRAFTATLDLEVEITDEQGQGV